MTVIALILFTGRPNAMDSIAILPIENLTGDPGREYFVDGVTDELIGQLTQIGALRVISRTSIMKYKGIKKPVPEIARELKVNAVVEGTVHRVDDSVRIRLELIKALPEEPLWTETYDRAMADVLVMYGEMARAIAGRMQVKLAPQEATRLAGARQVNPEAYDAYLKGSFHSLKLTRLDFDRALEYFELALDKDPITAVPMRELPSSGLHGSNKDTFPPANQPRKPRQLPRKPWIWITHLLRSISRWHASNAMWIGTGRVPMQSSVGRSNSTLSFRIPALIIRISCTS
jgi:TolB-like protein